jgi:regulator of replication initiation timing
MILLWTSDIQELKKQLAKEIRKNYALERELQRLEKKIALLIQNRTSIQV